MCLWLHPNIGSIAISGSLNRWDRWLYATYHQKQGNHETPLIGSCFCCTLFHWLFRWLPPRKLTYPTWGKGKSSSNMTYQGDMVISWRVSSLFHLFERFLIVFLQVNGTDGFLLPMPCLKSASLILFPCCKRKQGQYEEPRRKRNLSFN